MCTGKADCGKVVELLSLDPQVQDLIRRSVEVREKAYCPYSEFKVGATLMCDDGSIFSGCNVENSAHGTICAERSAIVHAVSEGRRKFTAVAVTADPCRVEFTAPCGACRQFIAEFGNKTVVYLARPDLKKVLVTSIQELLPLSFHLRDVDAN